MANKKGKISKKKSRKLNPYTEKKNKQRPVKLIKGKVISETELPETKAIIPITEFAMPIAKPEQLEKAMDLYQKCVNALVKSKDIVMVENKPHGKKIAVNKINRVFGVSTEVLRSIQEQHVAHKDFWSKGFRKSVLVKKGEIYLVAKAWVKAILPNGQFCTRGAAVSETERRFAHTPHDLIATAETRAMKNAATNLLAIEFEMVDEQDTEQKPKTYKPKPSEEQGYKHSEVANPKMPASLKQKEFINVMIEKIKNDYETETKLEKPVNDLNKGEASDLIRKLLAKGKALKKQRGTNIGSDPDRPLEEP